MERTIQDVSRLQIVEIIGPIGSCLLEFIVVCGGLVAALIGAIAGVANDWIKDPPTVLGTQSACKCGKLEEFEEKHLGAGGWGEREAADLREREVSHV